LQGSWKGKPGRLALKIVERNTIPYFNKGLNLTGIAWCRGFMK
jgi:hypothetical protein